MMGNVQNCDTYINIPSSQIYRFYLQIVVLDLVRSLFGIIFLGRKMYPGTVGVSYLSMKIIYAASPSISVLVPNFWNCNIGIQKKTNKLHGLSPRANYTDRATTTCRRSDCQLLRIKGATWSA
jgi:hypothetical protein